jgi:hypothetical protein
LLTLPEASQRSTVNDWTAGESYAVTSNGCVIVAVRPRLSVIVVLIVFAPAVFSSFVVNELPEYVAPLTVVEIDDTEEPDTPDAVISTPTLLFRCT